MSRGQGKGWEAQLAVWHRRYLHAGKAYIVKTEPPVKVLGPKKKGVFRACYEGLAPVDFVGVAFLPFIADPSAVFFDAKSVKTARFPLANIKPHQARCLAEAERMEACAFIALKCPHGNYVLRWWDIRDLWTKWHESEETARGEASLSKKQIEELGTKMGRDGWLDCL